MEAGRVRMALAAGLAMSLGWGLRGSIGGGPLGALIPGAMVALTLAALRGDGMTFALRAGAISAVAVSFGGEMTYGQTIGLLRAAPTFWWGLLGLTVKGAVWGLVAGPLVWMAFQRAMPERGRLGVGLALLVAGAAAGWKLVNEPKLIYFSNPVDKPRAEIWCGLLLGGVLLAGWLGRVTGGWVVLRAAGWGVLTGGFGFGVGSLLMLWVNSVTKGADGWKAMELFFGFWLGVGLAEGTRGSEAGLEVREETGGRGVFVLASLALAALAIGSEEYAVLRYSWAVTGALLLLAVPYEGRLWRAGALALPILPTLLDAVEGKAGESGLAAAVLGIGVAYVVAAGRVARVGPAALLVGGTGTVMALIKFVPAGGAAHHVAVAFVAQMGLLWWVVRGR